MKIFTDNRLLVKNTSNNIQNKATNAGRSTSSEVQGAAKNAGFDQITISRTSDSKMSDEQFINSLTKQLSGEVKSGASSYALEDLTRQVALNQYDVNASDTARKIISG